MGDFEKDLRDAFEGVEFTPSEQVWAGVEKGLRPGKKGIFFMWQTYGVAATLVLVLSLGYLFRDELFSGSSEGPATRELTQENQAKDAEQGSDKTQTAKVKENTDEPASDASANDNDVPVNDATPGIKDLQASTSQNAQANKSQASGEEDTDGANTLMADRNTNDVFNQESQSLINASVADEAMNQENEKLEGEGLLINTSFMGPLNLNELKESMAAITNRWNLKNLVEPMSMDTKEGDVPDITTDARRTSLNGAFGNGTFNPNGALGSTDLAASEALNLDDPNLVGSFAARSQDASQSDLGSISVGFGVGLPLGERWVLKTGLRYSQYRFMSTSNAYSLEDGQQLPIYTRVAFDNSDVRFVGEYELTNTLHSLSIPAQFGLKFVNLGRFGAWFNAGVAADYIVAHTVKGDLNFLETRKVDFSQSSFINRFNLNALTGLEFTYELNEKFALSGEVFFRQFIPLGSTESGNNPSPSVVGFGLGLNYYLKKRE